MARSPAEIQADIAVTRRLVERQLDVLERRLPHGRWVPYASAAGALLLGVLLSRVPFLRLIVIGARAAEAGLVVAQTAALMNRHAAERRRSLAA